MTERDPSLDLALRLLVAEGVAEDEARWAKRTAASISNWTGKAASRAELDALLVAPLPDGHDDAQQDEELEEIDADSDSAASATEHLEQADRGYSISHPPDSRAPTSIRSAQPPMSSSPPSGLEGLARLTRSGENSARIISTPPDEAGKAKGEDSGLIDLRAMSQSGETPVAPEVAAPAAAAAPIIVGVPAATPANVRPITASPPSSAVAPPSTMAAQVASAPQVSTPIAAAPKKKGSNVVWLAFGGLAAAAAVGVFFVTAPSRKASETSNAAAPNAEATKAASDENDKKAKEPVAMASTAATATATPEESASTAPEDEVALAPTAPVPTGVGKKSYPMATATAATTGTATTKPTATTKASASVEPPKPTPSGGSLDDVLGINKPPPAPTTTANTPDLPDKPEAADIRVAVNSKVGTANACVKGLDGPSSVSVVFSPAGTVTSVAVTSGPAKGTGAEACIKSAFSGAKVPRSKLGGTGYAKLLP